MKFYMYFQNGPAFDVFRNEYIIAYPRDSILDLLQEFTLERVEI